jgi:hypothetical protein
LLLFAVISKLHFLQPDYETHPLRTTEAKSFVSPMWCFLGEIVALASNYASAIVQMQPNLTLALLVKVSSSRLQLAIKTSNSDHVGQSTELNSSLMRRRFVL